VTKIARNAPCPCGSGRKYKKCCLGTERPAPLPEPRAREASEWDVAPGSPGFDVVADDEPESDDDRFWRLFWDRLHRAPIDQKIALAEEVIEHRQDFNGEAAFSLVEALVDPFRRTGRPEEIDRVIRRIEERRPEAYADESHWMSFWRAENAVFRPDGDLATPVAALLEDPARGFDEFFRLADRLRYHGRVQELAPAMLRALPRVESCSGIMEHGKWEYREIAFSLLLHRHLAENPDLQPDDPTMLAETAPVRDMESDWLERVVLHVNGRPGRRWTRDEFARATPREFADSVFLLTSEFSLVLHERHAWPRSRAELGREMLGRYLAERYSDRDRTRGRKRDARRSPYVLLPEPASADRFMASYLDFLGALPYRVAAFSQALPAWLLFLVERELAIAEDDVSGLRLSLRRRCESLPTILDGHVYDPIMIHDVRHAWASVV
jgi:hypothetical protein